MHERRDVIVSGIGVISPIGMNVSELLDSLLANRSGIGIWRSPQLTKPVAAGVIDRDFSTEFSKLELPYLDRCSQVAVLAARQSIADAGLGDFSAYGARAGLFYGTVCGGIQTEHDWVELFYREHKQMSRPYTLMASMLNAAPAQISIRHQILGPVMTHSSACTSSGSALGDAFRAIRDGYLDVAVAGGAEAAMAPAFIASWGGLRALAPIDEADPGRSCRPFSKDRSGLVLSEGGVFLVLESREHAKSRGASCYCRLSGYGVGADAYHIGSPHSNGQIATLRSALADAELQPPQIGYFNAHATATPGGDPVEAVAINHVFDGIPVSGTKGIHGHLLGAASAMEFAITALAVNQSFLPATAHLHEPDPQCELNHVALIPIRDRPIEHGISLSAGFGGTNVALIASFEHELSKKTVFAVA